MCICPHTPSVLDGAPAHQAPEKSLVYSPTSYQCNADISASLDATRIRPTHECGQQEDEHESKYEAHITSIADC
jgi:hypothetical protein